MYHFQLMNEKQDPHIITSENLLNRYLKLLFALKKFMTL